VLNISAGYVCDFGVISGQFSFKLEKIGTETFKYWEVDLASRQWEERKFFDWVSEFKGGVTSGEGDEHSVRCLRTEEMKMRMK